jgi:hypothetical protein
MVARLPASATWRATFFDLDARSTPCRPADIANLMGMRTDGVRGRCSRARS